ncbi:MAG TPA: hypothetical protein VFQ45_03125 [Longimicrobium sp.]|nr:hypothetical protein [Longimicrobium sp.]
MDRKRWRARALLAACLALLPACDRSGAGDEPGARVEPTPGTGGCRIGGPSVELPLELSETSGAAIGAGDVVWTHGDSGGDPILYGVTVQGRMTARVRLQGAQNRDWEDVAVGPCPGGRCVYLADIGNNRGGGQELSLYTFPEPPLGESTVRAAEYRAEFPKGAGDDAEALFVLPNGEVYLVTKGNRRQVELYRWPTPLRKGPVELVRVATLAPEPEQPGDRVTGAGASADGRWVALRTYGTLAVYRTADLLRSGDPALSMDLAPLGEPQGEAVALGPGGAVVLTSEGGEHMTPGRLTVLSCSLPD